MNIYQEGFRDDIFSSIFKLTSKIWLKITGIYVINSIIGIIMFIPIALFLFKDNLAVFFTMNKSDPKEIASFYQSLFTDFSVLLIFGIIIIALIFVLIGSWVNYFSLILSENEIKGGDTSFGEILKKSFNSKVFSIFGCILVIYLFFVVGGFVSAITAMIHPIIVFFTFLIYLILIFKLFLVIPAMILGNKSLMESFAFSFKHITFVRALKLFGISILVMIIIFFIALIFTSLTSIFKDFMIVGIVINYSFNILLGGFMMTLLVAAGSAMYYRYSEDIDNEDKFTIDELLVTD
jgi:hypothetical protein